MSAPSAMSEGKPLVVQFTRNLVAFAATLILFAAGAASLQAQDVKIVARPLTPTEIGEYGLTNTTQKAGGTHAIPLGAPAYLEVEVPMDLVVTQFMWSVDSVPGGSAATLQPSPLGTNVPIYSARDREAYMVQDRKILVPDKAGEYKLSVLVNGTTNGVHVSRMASRSFFGATYRGADVCAVCHSTPPFPGTVDQHTDWLETGHATFFTRSINGETSSHYSGSCVSCHTVGYDTTPGADNGGFDDVAADLGWTFPTTLASTNWDAVPLDLQRKANIQCENCHGPGDAHVNVFGASGQEEHRITVSLSAGNCGQCHDALTHHYKNAEWEESVHSHAYFRDSESCLPCHSSHGFIDSVDGDGRTTKGLGNEGIACAACHDPHADEGPHQLRPVDNVTLGNGTVVEEGGAGLLCMKCHKGRRDTATYIADQLGSPSSHFGPHHGPQADLLVGTNAYTFGMTIANSDHYGKIEDSCVHCHMQELGGTSFTNILHKAGGHTFGMSADGVDVTLGCVECHGEIDTFDIGGHDYNKDGIVEGVQTEIGKLLDQLAMLLPPVGTNTLDEHLLTTETNAAAETQLMVVYNYLLVQDDGSRGIHNPKFAAGLLDASLRAMGVTNVAPAAPEEGDVKIVTRPLTPTEIDDLGLDGDTPTSGGTKNVGLGQPAYLEVQVVKTVGDDVPVVVDHVNWSIDSQPAGSAATLMEGPLDNAVPIYSQIDRENYQVADRMVLYPDMPGQYDVSAQVIGTTNGAAYADGAVKEIIGATYDGWEKCVVCHSGTVATWEGTGHASFFEEAINGEASSHYGSGCISCHTLGYDTNAVAVNGGFDDVADAEGWTFPATLTNTNWDAMPAAVQAKGNIQCENCHGPASEHRGSTDPAKMTVSLGSGNCGQCHDALTHHVKNFEWNQSVHSHAYYRSSCMPCHGSEGYIDALDGDGKETVGMGNEGISCAACHDPHALEGPHQLRPVGSVALMDGVTTITEGGLGKGCMVCHRSRRDAVTYVTAYHAHYGPHHGPQTDMIAGKNAIEYGLPIASSRHLFAIKDSCVECHMQEVAETFPDMGPNYTNALNHVGGHTFALSMPAGEARNSVGDIELVGACRECHGEDITTFNFGGEDYDDDGTVEGVQAEISGLLEELAELLPPVGSPDVVVAAGYNSRELKAAYNYLFVEDDGSMGIHNPKYAAGLLEASITDLKEGVDADRDGLPDDWEMDEFGSLGAATGGGDNDGDGVNNSLERVTGTDPNKKDTDGDGVDDLAELQAGSDPLDPNSTPEVGVSRIYTAVELAFVPSNGVMYQVQAVGELSTGIWINVDEPIVGSGEEIQKFFSVRRDQYKFYRVIEVQ